MRLLAHVVTQQRDCRLRRKLALERELGVPIRFIGVGEGLDDLEVFEPNRFVERLLSD